MVSLYQNTMLILRTLVKVSGSYNISLPINWVRENGLGKGDKIEISELPDGSLKISKRG
jgi:phosphate uptake regulator